MTQGILLVGGLGTRLMPLTQNTPKPMLPVGGLPVTEHQLMHAKKAGITRLVLATSYLSEVFMPYFGDGSRWGMEIIYAVEAEPLGTGGGIRHASQFLDRKGSIVIINGDVLSSHDLVSQIKMHEERDADVTLHLTHVADARAFGCVPVDENGRVSAFMEKMEVPVANTINAGCYVFHPRVIERIPEGKVVSVEREIFPDLVEAGRLVLGRVDDSYWVDIGTPHSLLRASIDVVRGEAHSDALDSATVSSRSSEFIAMEGVVIASDAEVFGGSSIGHHSTIASRAKIEGSIVCARAQILEGVSLRGCFVAEGAIVAAGVTYSDMYIGVNEVQDL
ncbi:MAG: NDP-sugar synthase [Candidatus Nanopelagicaceae bacterium]|nr:NDP-sugar synthase [Candidatus Nanopelagicaceae bacterium]